MDWDDGLTGTARRIAETSHSPLRILAGPGTGKTYALMRRVARLIHDGTDPERILVCTFTRTAATDLRSELNKLNDRVGHMVHAGTLHSACFRILSQEDVLPMTGRVPRPLLDFEVRFLLEDLKNKGLGSISTLNKQLEAFNAAWATNQGDIPGGPSTTRERIFHRELETWLKQHKAMLIGEVIPITLRYLSDNPLSRHLDAYDHVLVDEYQDLNRAEQELIDLLAEAGTLTIVGDENQSIYSFRHAHPEGISMFASTHPITRDESLVECRRCPQRVVHIANNFIANNPTGDDRQLNVSSENPIGDVHIIQWQTLEDEAYGLASLIARKIRSGLVSPGDVLVMAPSRQIGYAIRDKLNEYEIPTRSFFQEQALDGDPKDLEKCDAQQAYTLLNLLVNPTDQASLRSWIGFGHESLRSKWWLTILSLCTDDEVDIRTCLTRLEEGNITVPRSQSLLKRCQQLNDQVSEVENLSGYDLVEAIFPESSSWSKPFRELAASIETEDFDASTLLDVIRTGITQPELPTDVPYVRVMSLHKAKGLTADYVVIAGCIEGLIPAFDDKDTAIRSERRLEEQRRLFYVAITRTRHSLIISSATKIPSKQAHKMRAHVRSRKTHFQDAIASRFVGELGNSRPRPVSGSSLLADVMSKRENIGG